MRSAGYDLSRIDSFVTVNETTISDVRKLLGTPSVIAQTKEGEKILGYALVDIINLLLPHATSARVQRPSA